MSILWKRNCPRHHPTNRQRLTLCYQRPFLMQHASCECLSQNVKLHTLSISFKSPKLWWLGPGSLCAQIAKTTVQKITVLFIQNVFENVSEKCFSLQILYHTYKSSFLIFYGKHIDKQWQPSIGIINSEASGLTLEALTEKCGQMSQVTKTLYSVACKEIFTDRFTSVVSPMSYRYCNQLILIFSLN